MRQIYVIFVIFQLILFPILFYQGQRLRKKVLKLPEAFGPRNGRKGIGKDLNLIFLGDSSICGVGVKRIENSLVGELIDFLKKDYRCSWRILAKSGLRTSDLVEVISTQEIESYDIAIIAIGVNDITSYKSLQSWLSEIEDLTNLLIDRSKIPKIIFAGLPPFDKFSIIPYPLRSILGFKARLFDNSLKKFCKTNQKLSYTGLDQVSGEGLMAIDGFHPSAKFYKIWAKHTEKVIHATQLHLNS